MQWTLQRVAHTLDEFRRIKRDSTDIEVKRASQLPENLPETVCAFANMPGGGTIILGVDERANFAVVGVPNPQGLFNKIVNQTRASVDPAPQLAHKVLTLEGKDILVIDVSALPLSERPARHRNKAYLRQSDGDYVMNDADLALIDIQKLGQTERYRFDSATISNTSIDDLDPHAKSEFCANIRRSSTRLAKILDDPKLLKLLNVLTPSGEVTLAGLYSLGLYPQSKAPQLRFTAAVQLPRGNQVEGARTRNRRDFDGPLPDLLEDALMWVEENAPRHNRYLPDGNMVEEPIFPPIAVREIVANALVHRDLSPNSEGQWVEIRINGDRLIVTNPGGLRGISKEQITSVSLAKNAVNPRLYEMAKHVRTRSGASVIEGEGGGVTEVLRQVEVAGLPRPTFADNGVRFTVVLYGTPVSPKPSETLSVAVSAGEGADVDAGKLSANRKYADRVRKQRAGKKAATTTKNAKPILDALAVGGPLSFQQIVEETDLTSGQVRYALAKLIEGGVVTQHGGWGNRNTTYSASE
ncbi:RNA-binding domain-containing protein [Trueperella pyogenes]